MIRASWLTDRHYVAQPNVHGGKYEGLRTAAAAISPVTARTPELMERREKDEEWEGMEGSCVSNRWTAEGTQALYLNVPINDSHADQRRCCVTQ